MFYKNNLFFTFFLLSFSLLSVLEGVKISPFNSLIEKELYLNTHYEKACAAYSCKNWLTASDEFERVIYFDPNSTRSANSYYYLGVCYFEKQEYDAANLAFSNYLKSSPDPVFLEEVFLYKFYMAEKLKNGHFRRPFGKQYLPKWLPGKSLALNIYDEIITSIPNHELAIQALYAKGDLLASSHNFKESIDTYQMLIRRFPKHPNTPLAYIAINRVYFEESIRQEHNPDLIALAELNYKKFEERFPRDERLIRAKEYVLAIKEHYGTTLTNMGLFYEKLKKPKAAVIYYQTALKEYPDTKIAEFCKLRIQALQSNLPLETSLEEKKV